MEGPTPVSALIHAATMVTAGVYMVARMNPLFSRAPIAMLVVAIVGAVTAFYSATIGLMQTDIKKVLAYSTVSQLGYMFLGCGVGAYAAGIFHLMTHAFFKGLLFLCAGSVIHAMGGEQDMRKMGGLRKKIPITYWTMLIATLAIAGIPGFAGFFSKDEILEAAQSGPHANLTLWLLGVAGAALTSFYMFRLVFLTFFGKPRYDEHKVHVHESPKNMTDSADDPRLPLDLRRLVRRAETHRRHRSLRRIFAARFHNVRALGRRSRLLNLQPALRLAPVPCAHRAGP